MWRKFAFFAVLTAFAGLVACGNNPTTPSSSSGPSPASVADIFQPTEISPPTGTALRINENFRTYEEYLTNQIGLAGGLRLPDEMLPACVALLYVREKGADLVVVGGAASDFMDRPSRSEYQVGHFLSEQFWGTYARGHVVNALFLVGKQSNDQNCGNRMLVRCGGAADPWKTCIRQENIAYKQIVPTEYTLQN